MKGAILIVALALHGAAQSQTLEQRENFAAAREAIQEINAEMGAALCFDQARLMIFGFVNKQQGHPIQKYVETGALPVDSLEYKLVAKGYEMESVMDNASRVHFMDCVKQYIKTEQ